jgi:hypothetical protein
MPDRAGLEFLGLMLGGVTAAVVLVTCAVVIGHLDGHWAIETASAQVSVLR